MKHYCSRTYVHMYTFPYNSIRIVLFPRKCLHIEDPWSWYEYIMSPNTWYLLWQGPKRNFNWSRPYRPSMCKKYVTPCQIWGLNLQQSLCKLREWIHKKWRELEWFFLLKYLIFLLLCMYSPKEYQVNVQKIREQKYFSKTKKKEIFWATPKCASKGSVPDWTFQKSGYSKSANQCF